MNYIAYYRVSTKDQHLGIEAQIHDVQRYLKESDKLIEEYSEHESGKNNHRIELLKAIEQCKQDQCTLLVAKLDRLSRDVKFIYTLQESAVKFVCCDMPEANNLTIGLLAVIAQDERERISARVKAALQVLKRRGVKLGSPQNLTNKARLKGQEAIKANARDNTANRQAREIIKTYQEQGLTFRAIATKLNDLNYKTRYGKEFKAMTVKRLTT